MCEIKELLKVMSISFWTHDNSHDLKNVNLLEFFKSLVRVWIDRVCYVIKHLTLKM